MSSPRILHLIWTFNPGGAERIAQAILERCVREGWEAHACALAASEPAAKEEWSARGIRIHEVLKRSGLDFTLPFRLWRLLSRERISLLHTHNAVCGLYGSLALQKGVRHVHTEHSNVERGRFFLRLVRAYQLRSAALVAVSRKVATTFSRSGGIPHSQIRVIYNGVRVVPRTENRSESLLAHLGIPQDAVVVGTIGNLRAVKDHVTLLSAFAPIARETGNAHLLIVGEGEERRRLEEKVLRLGLRGRVSLPGFRSDVEALLSAMDVFVLCSRSEGFPVALLEAMAMECPCIATAVGGVLEIIQSGENGLLVPAQAADALTRAIRLILSTPSEAERFRKRGRETVLEKFTEAKMFDEYLGLYREMP
ncbi:MAG: glycosyltransferase [Pseudomonadota bacterium]